MWTVLCSLLLVGSNVLASSPEVLERNLVYRSPYSSHPGLALDTKSIHARHLAAGDEIEATLKKRAAATEVRPSGSDDEYTYSGYGLGVAYWGDADYVYAGQLNYTHAVASGDPFDYSILLWTRAYPTDEYRVDIPMCVEYKVYAGEEPSGDVVSSGWALTNADVDFTIKVEALGLSANTYYSYQFSNCADPSNKSPVGRTRTAPGKTQTNVAPQRFAIYSCANYPNGFFSSYSGPTVHQDTDYVVHLGDYIYESGRGGDAIGRVPSKGTELATLDDYRQRYAQYRDDQDLQGMHQQFPIIAIWDDHETANNDWKAGSSNSNDSIATGGCAYSNNTICFSDRAINAKRAYHEWIPIRQVDLSDEGRIWRDFRFGDLVDILALDTRKYDRDVTDVNYNTADVAALAVQLNSSRSITGPKQEQWFEDTLSASKERATTWRMVLNQVIFGTIDYTFSNTQPFAKSAFVQNYDSWDGYQAQRQRLMQYVDDQQIDNIAIFTGDTHSNWLFENNLDTVWVGTDEVNTTKQIQTKENSYQRGQIVEYGGTAVSSSGWGASWGSADNSTTGAKGLVASNGGMLYTEGFYRGYMQVTIDYSNITTTWYAYPGNQEARVDQNRTFGMQAVQMAGYNQIQRPLMQPVFGAIKEGN